MGAKILNMWVFIEAKAKYLTTHSTSKIVDHSDWGSSTGRDSKEESNEKCEKEEATSMWKWNQNMTSWTLSLLQVCHWLGSCCMLLRGSNLSFVSKVACDELIEPEPYVRLILHADTDAEDRPGVCLLIGQMCRLGMLRWSLQCWNVSWQGQGMPGSQISCHFWSQHLNDCMVCLRNLNLLSTSGYTLREIFILAQLMRN